MKIDRLKHKMLFLLLIAFCHITLHCVNGRIVDEQGKAISGAAITDQIKTTSSNAEGIFSLETKSDSLFISRLGFSRKTVNIRDLASPIVLSAEDIIMPTVWVRALDYKPSSPSISAQLIYPDTNAKAESTTELLLENPAFSTTDTRLTGERQTVSLLGSLNRHSLVLLDGVVLNAGGEAFDFSQISLSQISHIEIIKGNASVYGGSAAIGGIIHIHTKNAARKTEWEAGINTTAGSFGLAKQSYNAYLRKNSVSLNAEYTHQAARNDFAYNTPEFWGIEPELKRTHNRKTADNFFAKAGYQTAKAQFDYSLNAGSFVRQLPGTINFLELYDDSHLAGSFAQQNLRSIVTDKLYSGELLMWWNTDSSTYRNLMPTNAMGKNHYSQSQQNKGIKTAHSLNWESTKLSLNAEYSKVNFNFNNLLSSLITEGNRENTALAFRALQNFYPFFFASKSVAAIRGDYSKKKLHPTWRLEQEFSIPLAVDIQFGGYVGTAFSQPSLFDMYWMGDSETQGNPNLESESSLGYSVYGSITANRLKVKAALYQSWVENLIQWRQYHLNGTSWKPFNVGTAELTNYELEAQLQVHKWLKLSGGITFTQAFDFSLNPDGSPSPAYHKKLVYTPDAKATAAVALGDEKRGLTIRYSYTGKQFSTMDNLIEPLPPFDNLDAAMFYNVPFSFLNLQIHIKANNLMDKRYEIYAYTPQPGINWMAGLSLWAISRDN